jgi:transposase
MAMLGRGGQIAERICHGHSFCHDPSYDVRSYGKLTCLRYNTLINQIRAILLERGLIFAAGRRKVEVAPDVLPGDQEATLSPRMHQLIVELRNEWKVMDTKIAALNAEFVSLARHNLAMRRLTTIPGIGVLNATALVAAIGDASSFKHARDLGAWLGLVPRQFTTGGKPRLVGRTRRGNNSLRTLLVHGARRTSGDARTQSKRYARRPIASSAGFPRYLP